MQEKIDNMISTQPIFVAFILTLVFSLLSIAVGLPTMQGDMDKQVAMFIMALYQSFLAVLALIIMTKLKILSTTDFSFKNSGKGLLLGWIVFVLMAIIILSSYFARNEYFTSLNPPFLIIIILFTLSTGILEEVIFRGLILKILIPKNATKKNIILAFLISAALFSLVHLIHLFWAGPLDVIGDLLFAVAGGMLLGAIYLRTKTLIAPILLHWLLNLSGGIFEAFTSPEYLIAETNLNDVMVLALIAALPLVIVAFFLIRKVDTQLT